MALLVGRLASLLGLTVIISLLIGGNCIDDGEVWILNMDYKQLVFCRRYSGIYAFGLGDMKVDVLNLDTEEIQETFILNYSSEQLSVSPYCETITVTHQSHLSVMRAFAGSEHVTEYSINLDDNEAGLRDVVMRSDNMVVVFSEAQSFVTHVRCLELNSGNITQCTNCKFNGYVAPHAVLHPNHEWIIVIANGLYKLEFSGDCVSQRSGRSDYSSGDLVFLSESGSRVFDLHGRTFNIDLTEEGTEDFNYYGSFNSSSFQIVHRFVSFAQSSLFPHDVFTMEKDEDTLIVYSWPYLNPVGEAELPLAPGAIEFTYEQIHYDEEEDVYYTVADYAFGANTLPGISKIKTTYTPYPPRPEPDEGIHTVYQGKPIWLMKTEMSDIKFCQNSGDEPLFIGLGDRRVYVMNTDDYVHIIELPLPSGLIEVSDDCRRAVVTHNAYVSHIDLLQGDVTVHHSGIPQVSGLVYGHNDMAYMIPVDGSSFRMYCINLNNGSLGECSVVQCIQLFGNSYMYKHPYNPEWLYIFTSNVSPQSLERFSVAGDHCVEYDLSNPDHGPSYGSKAWFSYDATRMLTDIGRVISTDTLDIKGYMFDGTAKRYYWYEASAKAPHHLYVLEEFEQDIIIYSWPLLFKIGKIYFPRTSAGSKDHQPRMVKLSPDDKTIYTLATYTIDDTQYHGIGSAHNFRMVRINIGNSPNNTEPSLLRANKPPVAFSQDDNENQSPEGSSHVGVIVGVVGGAILCLIVAIALVLAYKQSHQQKQSRGMLHAIHIGEMDVNDKAELVIDTPIQDGLADN